MTISSQKGIINRYGMISQCAHDLSSMKWKNYDVQSDEKYFSTTYIWWDIGSESDLFSGLKIEQRITTNYTEAISSGASYSV